MVQDCKYDPVKDIQPVDQFGFVDIVKANANSAIEDPIQIVDERYNGIEDPRSIGTRPADQFEEMQANKAIVGYKAPAKQEEAAE